MAFFRDVLTALLITISIWVLVEVHQSPPSPVPATAPLPGKETRACGQLSCCDDCSDEVPVGSIAAICLFVTRCDSSEFLDLCEIVFDEVPPRIHRPVEDAWRDTVGFRRDDGRRAALVQICQEPVRIESPVGQQRVEIQVVDQRRNPFEVMRLAGQQDETRQITQCIDKSHDLGRQAAA